MLLIVGATALFGWVLTTTRVTDQVTGALLAVSDNPLVILCCSS